MTQQINEQVQAQMRVVIDDLTLRVYHGDVKSLAIATVNGNGNIQMSCLHCPQHQGSLLASVCLLQDNVIKTFHFNHTPIDPAQDEIR